VLFDDLCDDEFPVHLSSYLVAHAKAHALQRRMVHRVSACFAGRFKTRTCTRPLSVCTTVASPSSGSASLIHVDLR